MASEGLQSRSERTAKSGVLHRNEWLDLADFVEKLGAKNLREFFQSRTARRARCFGPVSGEKQFEVLLRANIFVIRRHRPKNPSFSTESAMKSHSPGANERLVDTESGHPEAN